MYELRLIKNHIINLSQHLQEAEEYRDTVLIDLDMKILTIYHFKIKIYIFKITMDSQTISTTH